MEENNVNEKTGRKPINLRLAVHFMRGTLGYFIAAAVGLVAAVLSAYLVPIVTSFTIDYALLPFAEAGYVPGDNAMPAFVIKWVESLGGKEFLLDHLLVLAITLVLVRLINALSTFLRQSCIARAGETIAKNMRDDLYGHLANVPFDYYKHVSTGDLVQRCTSDVDTVRRFIQNQLLEVIRTLLMVVTAAVIMLRIDPMLTLWSVILMPFLALASFIYFKAVKNSFTQADEAEGRLSAAIQENLTGVRVVRAFGQQKREFESFTEKNADYKKKNLHVIYLMAYFWSSSDAFGYLQIMLSLCLGALYAIKGRISVGEMLVFVSYTGMLTWPVRQLGRILADLGKASVSLGRIDEIMSAPLEEEPGRALTPEIKGRVEFKNVGFSYEDSTEPVLQGVSFTADPGETVAILGSTGSGKSTLVQLIQRL